jgi:hypothetical protein
VLEDAVRVLEALHGASPGSFTELRLIDQHGRGAGQLFFECEDTASAVEAALTRALQLDVLFSVAPRTRREGTREAVGAVPAVWVDVDDAPAAAALRAFDHPPSFVIASGTPGNLHAYWLLEESVEPAVAEELNAAFANVLGGDAAATDAARLLRLPGTRNHKSFPSNEVKLVEFTERRYGVETLRRALPGVPESKARRPEGVHRQAAHVAAPAVQRVLDRLREVRRTRSGWMALCPAHDDTRPSLSIGERDDGRCLLHCFAGCPTEKILAVLGLGFADLFPEALDGEPAAQLVNLAERSGVEFFHDDKRQPLAWVPVSGHREVWAVGSARFRHWLRNVYRAYTDQIARAQPVADAIDTLAAKAEFEGAERGVFVRVARRDNSVYLDLGDDAWTVVEMTPQGWGLRADSPVPFLRNGATMALPEPQAGASLEELREFVNVPGESGWRLVIAFVVMALQPDGPFPILVLQGEQGAAKTTTARALRLLIDPVKAMLRAGSPSERDLMIAASRQWVVGFDNVSRIRERLSDALCQLSTGAGFATRQLYTDADEVVFEATRPLILNGIGGIADRPDFLSRALILVLPQISEEHRRPEAEFWGRFDQARPRILGALLDTLVLVLAELPGVELETSPRLADFARLGVAVERVLGWPDGSFLAALDESQSGALEDALDAEPIADPVIRHARKWRDWAGTMTELLAELEAANEELTRRREWPKSAAQLGIRLRQIAPSLREVGVAVDESPVGRDRRKRRGIRLRLVEEAADGNTGDGGDGGDGARSQLPPEQP